MKTVSNRFGRSKDLGYFVLIQIKLIVEHSTDSKKDKKQILHSIETYFEKIIGYFLLFPAVYVVVVFIEELFFGVKKDYFGKKLEGLQRLSEELGMRTIHYNTLPLFVGLIAITGVFMIKKSRRNG